MEKKTKEGTDVMRILKSSGEGLSLLGMNIPIFMQCPHCDGSKSGKEMPEGMVYAGCISQLQRIFLVQFKITWILHFVCFFLYGILRREEACDCLLLSCKVHQKL